MNTRFLIRCMIILTLIFCSLSMQTDNKKMSAFNFQSYKEAEGRSVILETIRDSIIIDSDEDLINLGFSGNGSLTDPFLIEDIYIAGGVSLNWGLYITNVTKHLIIQNCVIETSNCIVLSNLNEASVKILNTETVVLDHFNPAIILTSITIQTCSNVIIDNCNFDSKIRGIDISNSNNVTITNSNFASSYNTEFQESKYCGIYSIYSLDCNFMNNSFEEGGFYFDTSLEDFFSFELQNNKLGELQIGFIENQTDLVIASQLYGQLFLFNCSNSIIKNQVISNAFSGISCYYSSGITLSENDCQENQYGIVTFDSNQTIIENNLCNNNIIGIAVKYGLETIVNGNECCNNSLNSGIEITCNSIDTQVINNNCSFNSWGYGIYESSNIYIPSINTTLIDNVCNSNYNGISFRSSEASNLLNNTISKNSNNGLWLSACKDFVIMNNKVTFNGLLGIAVSGGSKGSIAYKLLLENMDYGISLNPETNSIIIHHNSFFNNNPTSTKGQARDDGSNNYWYNPDTFVGNYWSDRGRRNKYPIEGNANSYDLYPLKNPVVLPDESHPLKTNFLSLIIVITPLLLIVLIKTKFKSLKKLKL